MRISDVLFWSDQTLEVNRSGYQLDVPTPRVDDDLTNLAKAFTRRGLVKHFWNANGSEEEPSGLAAPDAETNLVPNGTLEPNTAFRQDEPLETEPVVGQYRIVPFRPYREISGD